MKLTPAQVKWLARADALGNIKSFGLVNGLARASFFRMMKRLKKAGYVVDGYDSEFTITDAGRKALSEAT